MSHEKFMNRCFVLAKMGQGKVKSNPYVGSVIVHNDVIIGEGYHKEYGSHHAEVNAINSVLDKSLLKESTIYVNLEPCSHYGKTPPCADLIVKHEIPRVIISNRDPHNLVDGKGILKLKGNGADVKIGVLEKEGWLLNKRFFTFQEKKRPYILLKWAQSIDGFMDIDRTENQKGSHWITSAPTGVYSHKLRSNEMGILVGANTVKTDDPTLTTRNYNGNNPIRIVIDSKSEINDKYKVLDNQSKTIIYNTKINAKCGTNEWVTLSFGDNVLSQILDDLYKKEITSILIEGGRMTLQSFIDSGFWDEAHILEGPEPIRAGLKSPEIDIKKAKRISSGVDSIYILKNNS